MFIFGIKINNNGIIRKDRKYNHYIFNPNLRRELNKNGLEDIMAKKKGMKLIANNKKAFHDYFIEDTIISPL